MVGSIEVGSKSPSAHFGRSIDHLLAWGAVSAYVIGYTAIAFKDEAAGFQYLHYLVPLILCLSIFLQHRIVVRMSCALALCSYGVIVLVSFLLNWGGFQRWSVNSTLIFLIILLYVFPIRVSRSHISAIFSGTFLLFLIAFAVRDHEGIRLLQLLMGETASAVGNEYNNEESLIGPLYAIYFFFSGSPVFGSLAAAMTILGGKRIGLVALLVAVFFLLILSRAPVFQNRSWRFGLLLVSLSTIACLALNMTFIAERLHLHLGITVSLEEVMLGRYNIGSEFARQFQDRSVLEMLFGSGPGAADDLTLSVSSLELPHNDWMKLLYDYGILGLVVGVILISYVCSTSFIGMGIGIAMALLMVTDNVLVYIFFHIPLALIINALETERVERSQKMGV